MNKEDLLEQYNEELVSLDNEIEHHKGRNNKACEEFCKGERAQVRQFIADLNNLTVETVKCKEDCLRHKTHRCHINPTLGTCKNCDAFE